jgi:sulfate adenylyltransferase large subunit
MAAALASAAEHRICDEQGKDLLRFSTAGSVDDGKSTLIGRLLYDSKSAYEDQIASIRKASENRFVGGPMDFSLLTDGLRAEREQGITIDVAYRYFATARRKFIIADTPGHEQYTRNMATGASTSDLAIVLIDATKGVLPQSRRHAYIASLLGINHIVVAINKMDLVDYRQEVFEDARWSFSRFARDLDIPELHFLPISALKGDNVVSKSAHMPWFTGVSLLEYLETVTIQGENAQEFRFPIQYVIRPSHNFRGYAGQIVSGRVCAGDTVKVLQSGLTSRISRIATYDGDLEEAWAPMSVTICLEDEIDISRGDMLSHVHDLPFSARRVEAKLVWMTREPLERQQSWLLKHTTQVTRATVQEIRYKIDINSLEQCEAETLVMNEIATVVIEAQRPLFFDTYRENRGTGSFILIDPLTNGTVAAGMISGPAGKVSDLERVSRVERETRFGHGAVTVCLHGRARAGSILERMLFDRGCLVHLFETRPDFSTVRLLHSLGFIVLSLDDEFAHDFETPELPEDDWEAASVVYAALREQGLVKA